jgi:histidinol-phosphate aminotransferase
VSIDITSLVPEHIRTLIPYVPGKPIEELERELGIKDSIKLASNENPIGPSPKALEAISRMLHDIHRYPEGSGFYLKQKLAQKHRVSPDQIILGNGSNEAIEILMRTFLQPGDEAVISKHAFVVYPLVLQAIGGKGIFVPMKNYTHDVLAMAAAITPKTKMVFIANPNNPTGTMVGQELFDKFMNSIPERVIVAIDEAYDEYVEAPDYPDSLKYLREGRQVVIFKTFSKIYGLAGLRIGYGIAPEEFVEVMNRVREPFNVNSVAQAAALAAIDDREHVEKCREINRLGKQYLYKKFEEMGLSYVPSEANFILLDVGQDAGPIYEKLLRYGVIVRPVKGYGFPNHLRVTIGTEQENERFIEALKKVLGTEY